jgi:uncharacterized protein YyaL (SSP411 family)
MLRAFSAASKVVDDKQRASQYLEMATRNADFLLSSLRPNGSLRRSWRNGQTSSEVFLEDYASLILGLLELYQTDFNDRWFTAALELCDEMIERFADENGGFFDSPSDGKQLLVRPKDLQDNALPSGNSLACEALLQLADFTGNGNYRDLAEKSLHHVSEAALRYPTAFAFWLSAADYSLANVKQVAILYETEDKDARSFLDAIRAEFRPNLILAASTYPPSDEAPALLKERPVVDGKATAYVCENFVCKLPVVGSRQELLKQL